MGYRLRFTEKAREEMECDALDVEDVRESLVSASAIYKSIRSSNPRTQRREHLHIIQSPNFAGLAIYTKGKLVSEGGVDVYYVLVSSKRAL